MPHSLQEFIGKGRDIICRKERVICSKYKIGDPNRVVYSTTVDRTTADDSFLADMQTVS